MLRLRLPLLLLGLATGGVLGCGDKAASAPTVVAGATAGDVLDVTGKVEAMRSGQRRTLATGDAISGDDVIETGPSGSIVFRLQHNGATVGLPSGRSQLVSASPAWALPPIGGATGSAEISAAAGRHTGEQEADTDVSAAAMTTGAGRAVPPAAEPASVAATGATEQPAPAHTGRSKHADDDAIDVDQLTGGAPGAAADGDLGGTARGAGGAVSSTAPVSGPEPSGAPSPSPSPPPPPPPDDEEAKRPQAQLPLVTIDVTKPGALALDAVRKVLETKRRDLSDCGVPATTTVTLTVDAAGKVTRSGFNGSGASIVACMTHVLATASFASGKATTVDFVIRP